MTDISVDATGLDDRCREEVLSRDAINFLVELHANFAPTRNRLLDMRSERQKELDRGANLDFLDETHEIRDDGAWAVARPRPDYLDRRVEITGPTDRKMVINALNSGARGFMADFEDANSPTWPNQIGGHVNLIDAVAGSISYDSADGRHYRLGAKPATLVPRPRGWHLPERHLAIDGEAAVGSLVDFGLFAFHCSRALAERGNGAYLYLPKIEHYLEARLWNDILTWSELNLGLPAGTFRATVLIETLPAAFQMDEILFEIRDHSYGLNAGRWDYIFSTIKSFRNRPEFVLPDRADVKMTVPFMKAYAELLVDTCHRRGAFAMGGMAALIPSRSDQEANDRAVAAVVADKEREAKAGFDGTWVAHPDVVDVAMVPFDRVLGDAPNQIDRQVPVSVGAADLLNVASTPGKITEQGLRNNLNVSFQYISCWLGGRGAVGLNNLMEDAATAEICRTQVWQWLRHEVSLADGTRVTPELVRELLEDELACIRAEVGEEIWKAGMPDETLAILQAVALSEGLPDFLTSEAYGLLQP